MLLKHKPAHGHSTDRRGDQAAASSLGSPKIRNSSQCGRPRVISSIELMDQYRWLATCRHTSGPLHAVNNRRADVDGAERYKAVLDNIRGLSYQELLQLSEDTGDPNSQAAFSATFMFWLSAKEKKAVGPAKKELSNLAAQLVYIKEAANYEATQRMLPPLASSLAYSNYSSWQADHAGQQLPDVALGVSIADLYKAAEREEAKLKQWQTAQRPASSLDSFAAASGYQAAAADAIARVRARLMGYADDESYQSAQPGAAPEQQCSSSQQQQGGQLQHSSSSSSSSGDGSVRLSPAAQQILQELLKGCCCREERATVLPAAFKPPGLEVMTTDGPMRVVTRPQRLLEAIRWRQQQWELQLQGVVQAGQTAVLYQEEQLPSGETLQQVLAEVAEDVEAFDRQVFSRMSKRDIYGMF